VRDGLSPAVVAPSKNSRGDPRVSTSELLRGRPRGTPATRGRRRVTTDVHVNIAMRGWGRSAVRVPVRGRKNDGLVADQHVHLCESLGEGDVGAGDVGVLGMTELGLDSRTK
jgi:hypothetical protein